MSVPRVTLGTKESYSSGEEIREGENPVFEARIYATEAEMERPLKEGLLDLSVEVGTFDVNRIRKITLDPAGETATGGTESPTEQGGEFHIRLAGTETENPRLPGHDMGKVGALAELQIRERVHPRPFKGTPYLNVVPPWRYLQWIMDDRTGFTLDPARTGDRERPESEGWRTLTVWLALDREDRGRSVPPVTLEYAPSYHREDWRFRFPGVRMVPASPTAGRGR